MIKDEVIKMLNSIQVCDDHFNLDNLLDFIKSVQEVQPCKIYISNKDKVLKEVGQIPDADHGFCSFECLFCYEDYSQNERISCRADLQKNGSCPGPDCPAYIKPKEEIISTIDKVYINEAYEIVTILPTKELVIEKIIVVSKAKTSFIYHEVNDPEENFFVFDNQFDQYLRKPLEE